MYAFIIINLIAFSAVGYFVGLMNLSKIKDNWTQYRCNPLYMPIAGLVDPNGISGNFQYCLASIGKTVMSASTDAIGGQLNMIGSAIKSISDPLVIFRQVLTTLRKTVMGFAASTLGKLSAPMSALVYILNKIRDVFKRIAAEGYVAAFMGVAAVSFIKGFVMLFISIVKGFVVGMLIISVILALFQPALLILVLILASYLAAAGA